MEPKYLKIRNFKSIGVEQTIELAPITLLFGPNSVGKSTVLQALIYLREVLLNRNTDADKTEVGGDWLDLGGFKNLLHGHNTDEPIEITVGFSLDDELPNYLTEHECDELSDNGIMLPDDWLSTVTSAYVKISVRWSDNLSSPYVDAYEVGINDEKLTTVVCSSDGKQIYMDELFLEHPVFKFAHLGPEEDDQEEARDFGTYLVPLINPLVLTRTATLEDSIKNIDQPFKDKGIDELEELINNSFFKQPHVLHKMLEELELRPARKASELANKVSKLIESTPDDLGTANFLNLVNQKDALLEYTGVLKFDDEVWNDEGYDEFDNTPLLRLMCESVISGLVVGPLQCLGNWLDDFRYIGPLRDLPPRFIQPQRTLDNSRWAKGLAAWELLYTENAKYVDEVNYWLGEKCLDSGYQVLVKEYRELSSDSPLYMYLNRGELDLDQQILVKEIVEDIEIKKRVVLLEEETGLEVSPQDIGVGISQLFPVVMLTVSQGVGMIAVEQPELHIHPAIQTELADMFARYAIKHNKIMLLETHSEHLMLRLLRRIRECAEGNGDECLTKESVSVQYVESTDVGTSFSRKRINDSGDFDDEWPNGFFEERDEELF